MSNSDEDDNAGTLADLCQRTAAAGTGAMVDLGISGQTGVIAGASFGILLEPLAAKALAQWSTSLLESRHGVG